VEESKIEIKIIAHEDVCLIRVKPKPLVNGKCVLPEVEIKLNSKIIGNTDVPMIVAVEDVSYIKIIPTCSNGECGVKIVIDLNKKSETTKA
jgi:hypothetical protein